MNDLQRLFAARGITVTDLVPILGIGFHTLQKVIKGVRSTPYVQAAIAEYLGLTATQAFGPSRSRYLRPLIEGEINRHRAEYERKLKAKFLNNSTVPARCKTVNG